LSAAAGGAIERTRAGSMPEKKAEKCAQPMELVQIASLQMVYPVI
jgi:hypothetical protein